MQRFLDPEDRAKLEQIAQSSSSEFKRPAQILLLADQGFSIRRVAAELGISRSGVFYWIRRYRNLQTGIFDYLKKRTISQKPEPKAEAKLDVEAESVPATILLPDLTQGPGVSPDDSIAEARRKTLRYHFAQMLQNEAGTIAGEEIEALHDMRVATRRMRAAWEVFGFAFKKRAVKAYLKGLRQTGRALGRVRDLDVFMEKAAHFVADLPKSEQRGLDPLLEVWRNQREFERAVMINHLQSPLYMEFKEQFIEFLQTPGAGAADLSDPFSNGAPGGGEAPVPNVVRHAVPLLVYTRLASVNAFDALLPNAIISQLHALRIEFKRLRYTLEFFVEVLGPQAKWVIQEIKQIQNHLGDLNDAQVASVMLGEILNSWEDRHRQISLAERPDPLPVANYLTHRVQERHRLIRTFPQAWERISRPEFRQNLALAVASL